MIFFFAFMHSGFCCPPDDLRQPSILEPDLLRKAMSKLRTFICQAPTNKTVLQPASRLEKLMEGLLGSSGGFGRKFPEGGLNFSEVASV